MPLTFFELTLARALKYLRLGFCLIVDFLESSTLGLNLVV